MKLIVAIGQSGSGKTTWVKNSFLTPDMAFKSDPIKHTSNQNTVLVGDYTLKQRTLGTDTLPYNFLDRIISFVLSHRITDKRVVLEGDRINNQKFFNSLIDANVSFELHYFVCDLEVSQVRLRLAGSKQTIPFMKSTKTKSSNMVDFLRAKNVDIIIHNT